MIWVKAGGWAMLALLAFWVGVVAACPAQNSEQGNLPVIPPDEAKRNLVTFAQPEYPPLARAARIAGIVRVSLTVDETGSTRDLKLISGHPMLAPAALEAIRTWKYKPFVVNGKVAAVKTTVEVSIPEHITQSDIDRERKFQDAYWPNERAGREALKKGELATAETKLLAARAAAEERGDEKWLELADVISLLGHVKLRQGDFDAAERLYKESLALHEKHQRPDEAEVAGAQENLGLLYFRTRQLDKAEPLFLRATASYEARIKETSMPEPLAGYGASLALGYFALSQIAATDGRSKEAQDRCTQAVTYAEKWSSSADRDVIVSACKSPVAGK